MAQLYCWQYFAWHCAVYSDGPDVGLSCKRERWPDTCDGGNQFINDAAPLWPTGQFVAECEFDACTLADNVIFSIDLCGIAPDCRIII